MKLLKPQGPALAAAVYLYKETIPWSVVSPPDYTDDQIAGFLEAQDASFRLVLSDDGERTVGLVGVEKISWIDRTGQPLIVINAASRRQGLGLEAAKLGLEFYEREFGIRRWQAIVLEDAPSIGILKKLDFTHEGTLRALRWKAGKYVNGEVYALVREE